MTKSSNRHEGAVQENNAEKVIGISLRAEQVLVSYNIVCYFAQASVLVGTRTSPRIHLRSWDHLEGACRCVSPFAVLSPQRNSLPSWELYVQSSTTRCTWWFTRDVFFLSRAVSQNVRHVGVSSLQVIMVVVEKRSGWVGGGRGVRRKAVVGWEEGKGWGGREGRKEGKEQRGGSGARRGGEGRGRGGRGGGEGGGEGVSRVFFGGFGGADGRHISTQMKNGSIQPPQETLKRLKNPPPLRGLYFSAVRAFLGPIQK